MKATITESIRQAGLEDAILKVAALFPKLIDKPLRLRVRISFDILSDDRGGKWILVTLEYDGRVTEQDIFRVCALENIDFMRERFGWLWERTLRLRLIQQSNEPTEEHAQIIVPAAMG